MPDGDRAVGRHHRRRTGRARRGLRAAPRRPPGDRLRGQRPAGRDDGARHPRVPACRASSSPARSRPSSSSASRSELRSGSASTSRSTSCSTATTRSSSAVGTGRGRDLDLPGHDQDGVLRAVEFLLNVNQGFRVDARRAGGRRRRRQRGLRRGPHRAAGRSRRGRRGRRGRRRRATRPARPRTRDGP